MFRAVRRVGLPATAQALLIPALRKLREELGTQCLDSAGEIKRLGHSLLITKPSANRD